MAREWITNFYDYFREKFSKKSNGIKAKGEISKKNMNNKSKPIRLSKAAREFNVSTQTIVSFLKKKGHEIATNPNAKITPEMYELLLKEYSREKSVKEEARKHNLKYTQKRSISIEDKAEEEESEETEEEEPDEFEETIFIKNTSFSSKPTDTETEKQETKKEEPQSATEETEEKPKEQETAKEQEAPTGEKEKASEPEPDKKPADNTTDHKEPTDQKEEQQPGQTEEPKKEEKSADEKSDVKVLGKIDLDSIEPKRTKSAKKTVTPKKDKEKQKEAPEEARQKPAKESKQESVAEKESQATQKKKAAHSEKAKEEKPQPTKKEQKAEPKEKAEKPQPKRKGEIAAQKSDEGEKQKKKEAKPQQEKTSKTQPQTDKPKQEEAEKGNKEKSGELSGDNFIKTRVEKLDGPKILGTIDLPESKKPEKRSDKKKEERKKRYEKKKPADKKPAKEGESDQGKRKPVASSKDESIRPKKKRRRRIKPEGAKEEFSGKGGQQDSRGAKPKPGKKPTKKPKRPQRHEPTEEEVQKQLKETMARLSGSGGKSKSAKHRRNKRDAIRQKEQEQTEEEKSTIKVTEFVTVNELANMMDVNVNQVISTCMSLGLFVSINQRLDAETINLVADEFGYNVEFVSVEVQEALEEQEAEEEEVNEEELEPRAPIITVMGHVDHGKTSLLDYIRQENVIGGEAGGITQHIGAYEVVTQSGKKITFLDTPGHEAFTAMRARGAQVTDIAIIIIAADDQIMPQTIEAINHAQAAGVPIVFAINKVDKPGANPDKIKEQLSHRNILVEEWGGKYQSQEISAKKGQGIEDLLEKVQLESEILELKGNPNKHARGAVIESSLDKGRGYVAKLLVQDGALKKGDYVLAGAHSGKVRAMYNELNQQIDEAGPSSPVLMLGLDGAPQAGDQFNVFEDEREAKELANKRRQLQREQGIRTQKHVTLDEIGRRIAIGDFKELNIIVKGDVDGSVEALADALLKLGTEEVQVNVIHKSVGQISESDIMLASASEAIIVGFQVRPSAAARRLADKEQIDIRTYSVIYKAIEEVKSAIEGMLAPKIEEKVVANLEVRDVFKITKVGTVAGCKVLDGVITRNTRVRVIRDGIVIYTGVLGSLKRYKEDVREVKAGYECGLNIQSFNDIKVGDIIEGFKEVEVERKLDE